MTPFRLPEGFRYEAGNLYLKSGFDFAAVVLCILTLAPVLVFCALAIAAEGIFFPQARGPALISQRRYSAGRPFNLYKFRTFYMQDDESLAHLKDTTWFINQRRQTRIGAILRKFYLDELPQLFNILKGEMSFVGPRPWPEKQYREVLELGFQARRVVKGGLCGPLQALKGAAKKPPDKFAREDEMVADYLSRSAPGVVLYDLWLIAATLRVVLRGGGGGKE